MSPQVVPIRKGDRKTPVYDTDDNLSTRELAQKAAFAAESAVEAVGALQERMEEQFSHLSSKVDENYEGLFEAISNDSDLTKRMVAVEAAIGQPPGATSVARGSMSDKSPEEMDKEQRLGTGMRGDMNLVMLKLGEMTNSHKRTMKIWSVVATALVGLVEVIARMLH